MLTAQEAYEVSLSEGERRKKIDAQIKIIESTVMKAAMDGKVGTQVELLCCNVLSEVNSYIDSLGYKTNYPAENGSWKYFIAWKS